VIVLDASAALELLLATPRGAAVASRLAPREESLHAPHLLDVEVAQVLRRYQAASLISAAEGARALDDLGALGVSRWAHDLLLPRIWALRANVTAYDACYLALAEALAAPLVTCDGRLARAPGHRAAVDWIR
jgi:predicted nucleic acid-binding protein